MRKIFYGACSALSRALDMLIGMPTMPIGGILDTGWQADGGRETRGELS